MFVIKYVYLQRLIASSIVSLYMLLFCKNIDKSAFNY